MANVIQKSLNLVFLIRNITVIRRGKQMKHMGIQRKLVETAIIIDTHMRLITVTISARETIKFSACSNQKTPKPIAI